jgi:hypothetical protein
MRHHPAMVELNDEQRLQLFVALRPPPPWAHHQLGFGSGGYTGFAGTKPFRFGIWTFGRLLSSMTSFSWMMPLR